MGSTTGAGHAPRGGIAPGTGRRHRESASIPVARGLLLGRDGRSGPRSNGGGTMQQKTQTLWNAALGVIAFGGMLGLAPAAVEAKGTSIRQGLVATGVDPDAAGQA